MASPPSLISPEMLDGILEEIRLNTPLLKLQKAKMDDKNKENESPTRGPRNLSIVPVYQPTIAPIQIEEQLHPFILRIFYNGVQQKIYRDDVGLYVKHHEKSPPIASEHIINLKLSTTYPHLLTTINALHPFAFRPGVKGIENSKSYHLLALDADGFQLPPGTRLTGSTLTQLVEKLKVSSEVELVSVGAVLDLPGGEKGFVEIEKEGNLGDVLKMMEKRGFRDLLVVEYRETGKRVRF